MSKKIVAIGGGKNGRILSDGTRDPYETAPMDKEIIRLTGKEKPHFLFIAHSVPLNGQEFYFETMRHIYGDMYGCECKDIKSNELDDKEKINELVEWADIIYEGGGNTLRYAWENGKVMCGVSAGANCWFKECSSDSLQIKYGPDQPLIGVECIGLVDGLFVPHCDAPGRLDNVKDLLKTSSQIGLSMSNCTALEIIDDEYRLITSDASNYNIKPYGIKSYWNNDEYIEEQIDDSLEFKPLSNLFNKNISTKK